MKPLVGFVKTTLIGGCISIFWQVRESGLKMCRSPFDTLRANGVRADGIEDFPFVLSLSKHGHRQARTMPESGYAPLIGGFLFLIPVVLMVLLVQKALHLAGSGLAPVSHLLPTNIWTDCCRVGCGSGRQNSGFMSGPDCSET